jgi:putative DNA primase/helicase
MATNDKLSLKIAFIDRGDRGRANNKTVSWKALRERLGDPVLDKDHTVAEYQSLKVDEKNRLKDVGAFVGGPVRDGVRKRENMIERSIVTLDLDASVGYQIDELRFGSSDLCAFEFYASSTRGHTPESPRLRIVLPLTRSVTADEYAPLSRILASKALSTVEESMDAIDDVSFRVAQIMYWPSVNSDGKFETIHNVGTIVDPDQVLAAFGDWRDWTQLPFSEARGRKRPGGAVKAEIPTEKRGFVGAFCRAYDVPAAIKTFLPDIYVDVDTSGKKARYTYAKGSGDHGAVVEDGGLFLYSNHGTDPCGERLVNSFDLVRLHLFGHLVNSQENTDPRNEPSFKAMEQHFEDDARVSEQLLAGQYDFESMFEDVEEEDDAPASKESASDVLDIDDLLGDDSDAIEWTTLLDKDKDGSIRPTLTNVALIIQNDPRFEGAVQLNAFTQEIVTRHPLRTKNALIPKIPIRDKVNGDLWSESHDNCVRTIIEGPKGKGRKGYGLKVPERDLKAAIDLAATKSSFHPVRDFLNARVWDGVKRLDTLFIRYLGAPDTACTRAISRLTLLGAVTRVFEPGHKFDFVTILEGLQGKGKSTFIEILAKSWFVELEGNLDDRKGLVEKMQGAWIIEIPELSGFGRSEIQAIKAMFSASKDKVRLAYDRRGKDFLRQCIFIGSTNDAEYLRDPTGGRRFWPVVCTVEAIDTNLLRGEIDQIWAEAVAAYRAMRLEHPKGNLPLYLTDKEAQAEALEMQESRRVETAEDAQAGIIQEWLDTPVAEDMLASDGSGFPDMDSSDRMVIRTEICLLEIWCGPMNMRYEDYNQAASRTLSGAMKTLKGWDNVDKRRHPIYGKQKMYRRIGASRFRYDFVSDVADDDLLG